MLDLKYSKKLEKLEGDYKPVSVAVIPVKESYPDFQNVPFQKIHDKSIIELAINNASQSKKVDCVVVSSESKNVLDFCRDLENDKKVPAHIRLSRAKDSKSNGIPIRDFMIQAAEKYSENKGRYPDIMLFSELACN